MSGDELSIRPAAPKDAEELAEVAIRAFEDDNRFKPPGANMEGPPGHDSVLSHAKWIENRIYFKGDRRGRIVGGVVAEVRFPSDCWIHGLFVDPAYHGMGYGGRLLEHLFGSFPDVRCWSLETPHYATRNRLFYEKMGFRKIGMTKFDAELGWSFVKYRKGCSPVL